MDLLLKSRNFLRRFLTNFMVQVCCAKYLFTWNFEKVVDAFDWNCVLDWNCVILHFMIFFLVEGPFYNSTSGMELVSGMSFTYKLQLCNLLMNEAFYSFIIRSFFWGKFCCGSLNFVLCYKLVTQNLICSSIRNQIQIWNNRSIPCLGEDSISSDAAL